MRNIRRSFYEAIESFPQPLLLAWAWNWLAETV